MDLSSFSDADFISLVANYNSVVDGDKNNVSHAAHSRGYTVAQLAEVDSRLTDRFTPIISCGLKFVKPFKHLNFDYLGYVLKLFENYERGVMPFPGSVSEQPAQIIEIFSALKMLKFEQETKARMQAQRNSKK